MARLVWLFIVWVAIAVASAALIGSVGVVTYPPALVDVRGYGALPNDSIDDSTALQAAWDACKDGDTLYLPPGKYRFTKRLLWIADGRTVDLSSRHAQLSWYGTEPGAVVTYGGITQRMIGAQIEGLSIVNAAAWLPAPDKKWDVDNTGIRLQNLSDFDIRLGYIKEFRRGIVLAGVVAYSKPAITFTVSGCKYGLSIDQSDPAGWTNRITFDSCHFGGCGVVGPPRPPPYDSASFIHLPAGSRGGSGWVFRDCDFETNYAPFVGFDLGAISYSEFYSCWFESRGQDSAGPHKMPFKVGKTGSHIAIIGGVQNSLDVQTEGQQVVQILKEPEGETVYQGTKPHVIRGNLQFQGKVQVQP